MKEDFKKFKKFIVKIVYEGAIAASAWWRGKSSKINFKSTNVTKF